MGRSISKTGSKDKFPSGPCVTTLIIITILIAGVVATTAVAMVGGYSPDETHNRGIVVEMPPQETVILEDGATASFEPEACIIHVRTSFFDQRDVTAEKYRGDKIALGYGNNYVLMVDANGSSIEGLELSDLGDRFILVSDDFDSRGTDTVLICDKITGVGYSLQDPAPLSKGVRNIGVVYPIEDDASRESSQADSVEDAV